MSRPTQAIIDLNALRANVQRIKTAAPTQRIIAVIKSDGYGHGAVRIAQAIETQVDAFAVCCLDEALKLREAGVISPIILLEGFFHRDELPVIANQQLHTVIHSVEQLELLLHTTLPAKINVWLKIDTGMRRLGIMLTVVEKMYEKLLHSEKVIKPFRLMSHLAQADERDSQVTMEQLNHFMPLVKRWRLEASLANSAGILAWPQTHFNWVRPGIMLYGVSPFSDTVAQQEGLQAVMQFRSELISVKQCQPGDCVGYGGTWRCAEEMNIGVIAVGYADGYPRHAPSGTPVLVNGTRVPLIGRVSMDMITVDLRAQPRAQVGDPVLLWGNELPIEEIATRAGTIGYELLCHLGSRVQRISL